MNMKSRKAGIFALLAMCAVSAPVGVFAQVDTPENDVTVVGIPPSDLTGLPDGPDVEGFIAARTGQRMQIGNEDGTSTLVLISDATKIKSSGGFLGLNSNELAANSLLNGLPVTVKTVQWEGGLVASQIELKNKDLKTAAMIRNGTSQRFAEQGAAIEKNAALAEALRGRVGDIDKYNIKSTTNVYFDTGKWNLSRQAEQDLCTAASEADAMENALLLIVGYTDSVGNEEYNQVLSERRAGRVVNYLQQKCGWKPWRVLTPTGMAESDPAADNSTAQGRAQNRRVSVNVLVSKSVDGM